MIPIDLELVTPLFGGVVVSLINKFIINNPALLHCCQRECCPEDVEHINARHNSENGVITTTVGGSDASNIGSEHCHTH